APVILREAEGRPAVILREAEGRPAVILREAEGRPAVILREAEGRLAVILREAEGRPKDLKNQILRRPPAADSSRMTEFLKHRTITIDEPKASKPFVAASSRMSLQAAEEKVKDIKEEIRQNEISRLSTIVNTALEKYVAVNYKDLRPGVKNYLTGSFLSDTMARNIYNALSAKRDEDFGLTKEDAIDAVQKSLEKMKKMGLAAYLPFIGAPIIEDKKARESFEASVPIIKEQLTKEAQAIADELNASKKATPVQAKPAPISPVIGEPTEEAVVNPTVKKLPYTAIKSGLFNDEEYEIEYNTFRSPVYVKGNGFPFTKEGTGSGRFSPKDITLGEERRGFHPVGVPYALLRKKSDGRVRILHTADDIKTLQDKGWKFTDEKEISYAELTLPDIFIKSLHNIDTHTRLIDIAKQQGIALNSENKFQLDLLAQAGLRGGIRGGAEIRFYLRNPKGKVIRRLRFRGKRCRNYCARRRSRIS
ncbi:MAG: hypothetical protein Q8O01_07750, partial [Candidatus Omnitrophota bacterium]|nr:hypothetical protein [Candidatus Omnitrophota bacterium]